MMQCQLLLEIAALLQLADDLSSPHHIDLGPRV